jgi:hypothetical protein
MSFGHSRVRLLLGGAALATLLLASAGCSSDDADVDANSAAATTTVAAAGSTSAPSTIASSVDPGPVLQNALAQLAAGYHFTSTFVVNGTQVLTADGDRIADASRFTVSTNGAVVNYITTPAGSWAQPDGGDWDQIDDAAPVSDPVAALLAPASIAVLSDDGTSIRLRATVSAVTLGVAQEGTADVDVVITGGAITEIGYSTTVDGSVGSVATTVGPVVDPTPIVAPV